MENPNNPFEETYDRSKPKDQVRELRDDAWNIDTVNGDYDAAIEKLRQSLDVEGVGIREINQSLGYEYRVRWLKGETELAVDGIRQVIADMKYNRRRDDSDRWYKRDQYEDHHLPWAAVIEATSDKGSSWRAIRLATFGALSATVSQNSLFRRETDPNANKFEEFKSRFLKNVGAGVVAVYSLVNQNGAEKLARAKFKPKPKTTTRVHRLDSDS